MAAEPERDRPGALTPPLDGDIVFDHVSFSYGSAADEVLHDVSFTVPAGSTLGILGGTGSGKSTLMYLLARLYELPPAQGRITIGGTDIADIRASWLRSKIGLVLQEPFLFSRTLSENIAIASEQADLQRVRGARRPRGSTT
jgi:ATP-binding cassette subfamily B protein